MKSAKTGKVLSVALALVIALSLFTVTASASGELVATPSWSPLLVNGIRVEFDAYNIDGANYFKLRDVMYTLKDTEKRFDAVLDYDNNAIALTSGKQYTPDGSEMQSKGSEIRTPNPTSQNILLDGREVHLTAYNIDDYN